MKGESYKYRSIGLTHGAYTVGWVCALPKEQAAAIAILDQRHEPLAIPLDDHNIYTLGSIGNHNIVIAYLPSDRTGNTSSSATIAYQMITTFPSIKSGLTPLSWAAQNGHKLITELLLEQNIDVDTKDQNDRTPLSWAAEKGHEAIVKLLIEYKADIETKDQQNQTPLLLAVEKGHEAIVKLLIEYKADIETKDQQNQTPLLLAVAKGHEAIVKLLLWYNANIETRDSEYSWTPLLRAARKGDGAIVELLLKYNANVEAKDLGGQTPLLWAVLRRHETVIKLLLEYNAEVEAKDQQNRTPLSWAIENRDKAIIKLLLQVKQKKANKDDQFDLSYKFSDAKALNSVIGDLFKRLIEYIVGEQLSWWPLSEPEQKLKSGNIRVYSMFMGGQRSYDDIPISFAESVFPELSEQRANARKSKWEFLKFEAIFLNAGSLMSILKHYPKTGNKHSNSTEDYKVRTKSATEQEHVDAGQNHQNASNTSNSHYSTGHSSSTGLDREQSNADHRRSNVDSVGGQPLATSDTEGNLLDHGNNELKKPVLYLTMRIGLDQSIARIVELGVDDKTTILSLRAAYKKAPPDWLKRVTGIKFYRFQCFYFKEAMDLHMINIHGDRQRYPTISDTTFNDYSYDLAYKDPWELDDPLPTSDVFYFFMHPEDCATSVELNKRLPVHIKGPMKNLEPAFGIHVEERYSILVIFIPASIVILLTLAATLWFIFPWLEKHPDDLQNATVPVLIACTVVSVFVQFWVSLIIFRWTHA